MMIKVAAAANCGGPSFSASTPVLTASGKAVAISKLRRGDKVIATDVKTSKTGPAAVSAVWLNHDANLFSLKVRSSGHTSVISTTWNHPFWDLTQHRWVKVGRLKPGDDLRAPSGAAVTALGGWTPRRHDGWMWDLTVPGPHDFYIQAAGSAVLVHNCPMSPLRLLHPRSSLSQNSLDYWSQQSTADIVASLRPGSEEPLLVKLNGLIMIGNTRITVLMERGFDVNTLPRVPYVTEPPSDPFLGGG